STDGRCRSREAGRSSTTTSSPRADNAATSARPMPPAPPSTATCFAAVMLLLPELSDARSARSALGKDALQGTAMHIEAARRLRHVAVAHFVDALDMFPADPVGRHGIFRRLRTVGAAADQRRIDV